MPSPVDYNPLEVTPESGVPNAEIRSQASPQDFGSQQAEATEKLGQNAEDLGLKYMQMATEAKAENTIANQFVPAAAKLRADYMQNKGMDAVKAQPAYLQSVTNLRDQFIGDANSPYEKQILSNYMVRHAMQETDRSAEYAGQQQDIYEKQTHDAMLDTYSNNAAQNYINPDIVDQNIKYGDNLVLKRGLDQGENPDVTIPYKQALNRDKTVKDVMDAALANGDVPAAQGIYNKYKDTLTAAGNRQLEAALQPKISDYDSRSLTEHMLGQETRKYHDIAYGPAQQASPIDFVMKHEGGYVSNDSGKGPTNFGINQEANPDIDVSKLTQDQAKQIIQTRYADRIGADKMSPDMAAVAVDSAVNMGVAKTQALVMQSDGDPQKLIDLRRQEYQRLATENPDKYGKDLPAWNSRLDDLQKSLGGQAAAIDTNGKSIPSMGDYYKANFNKILSDTRDEAAKMRPNDIDFIEKTEARTKQQMDSVIDGEKKQNEASIDAVTRAMNGDFTKGTQPATIDELTNTSPQVKQAWDQLQQSDPKAAAVIANKMVGGKQDGKLGSGFSYLQQKAYNGDLTTQDLLYHVGDDLTQEGFKTLHSIVKNTDSLSSSDKSDNDSMATFLKYGHDRILHSSLFANTPEAEQQYQAWFSSVNKQIQMKQGDDKNKVPIASMLDKTSKDYVGGNIDQFLMPVGKQLSDRATRVNGLRPTITNVVPRLPNETPEEYFARVK